jgi:hypothetical protein
MSSVVVRIVARHDKHIMDTTSFLAIPTLKDISKWLSVNDAAEIDRAIFLFVIAKLKGRIVPGVFGS